MKVYIGISALKRIMEYCDKRGITYGCSFVAKLSLKKFFFFFEKIFVFFTKYTLFPEKMFLYGKKVLY